MTKALAWIRKSKGEDTDIGLEEQRTDVPELARQLADDVDVLDLGVHTGFSTLTRPEKDDMLDDHPDVQQALADIRDGEYDYLVALDDDRLCRDNWIAFIEKACIDGDCEIEYLGDVPEDDMAYDINRTVEEHVKREEIEKSRQAIEARQRKGYDHGRPPFGFEYDDDGRYWVPDEDFETAVDVLRRRDGGDTYSEISEETGVAEATISRILDRREMYLEDSGAA